MKKKINGITLIALVITIIILLILAGISIAMLTGENGILTKAIMAQDETKKAQYKEEIQIIIMEKRIEKEQEINQNNPLIQLVAKGIEQKEWSDTVTMCDEYENNKIIPEECNKIIVETKDGYEIIVNINNDLLEGEIVSITKGKTETWMIKFDANGGKGEVPKTIEVRKGFWIKLPQWENLSKEDYKMVGWSVNDEIYAAESVFKPEKKETIFYATWALDTVELTFHNNTGEGEMKNISPISGKNIQLPSNTFTKYGYSFKEWNTSPTGNGIKYTNNATINITENTTLYAIWNEEVTATLAITNNKFTEGTQITLGGSAIAHGIQKVELKVGNNILYTENGNSKTNYNKVNLRLNDLNQVNLGNLNFNDINVVLAITSTTGKVVNVNRNIKNYTIGNSTALNQFAQLVNSGESLSKETIIQLQNIITTNGYVPIGYKYDNRYIFFFWNI